MAQIQAAKRKKLPLSIGLLGNAAEIIPKIAAGKFLPDIATDQTSAHDTLNGYIPKGMKFEQAAALRKKNPEKYIALARASIVDHVKGLLKLKERGVVTFDYGNNIRGEAFANGVKKAFSIPGFVPEYIRPLFCDGKGPFRWAALSGEPDDIYRTDEAVLKHFRKTHSFAHGSKKPAKKSIFKDSRRASAGSDTVNVQRWDWSSINS